MTVSINKTHLAFLQDAKDAFEARPLLETYWDKDNFDLIALRFGMDRDCILLFELDDEIANFVQQMEPCPKPRRKVMEFAHDMEKQLRVNDHNGGWSETSHFYLLGRIHNNLHVLERELRKEEQDKHEITILCTNIANYAMMIADIAGEHL